MSASAGHLFNSFCDGVDHLNVGKAAQNCSHGLNVHSTPPVDLLSARLNLLPQTRHW